MNIIFIDHVGLIKVKNTNEKLQDFANYKIESYNQGKYTYNIIKLNDGIPIKLKFCRNLINFSIYIIKTNKNTGKILDIKVEEVIDINFLQEQITNYDSDESSDVEYDICDKLIDQIC